MDSSKLFYERLWPGYSGTVSIASLKKAVCFPSTAAKQFDSDALLGIDEVE